MSGETPAAEHETEKERVDRELIEFLNEVRVVLPGVQVLFAFLLTLPFTGTFKTITGYERTPTSIAFFSTALAAVLMITPTSFHRLRFRKGDKEQIIRTSQPVDPRRRSSAWRSRWSSVVWLVSELLFSDDVANIIGVARALIVIALWFALPLPRRFGTGEDGARRRLPDALRPTTSSGTSPSRNGCWPRPPTDGADLAALPEYLEFMGPAGRRRRGRVADPRAGDRSPRGRRSRAIDVGAGRRRARGRR